MIPIALSSPNAAHPEIKHNEPASLHEKVDAVDKKVDAVYQELVAHRNDTENDIILANCSQVPVIVFNKLLPHRNNFLAFGR